MFLLWTAMAMAQEVDLEPDLILEPNQSVEWTLSHAGDQVNIGMQFPPETCVLVDVHVTGTGVVQAGFWFDVGHPIRWTGGPASVIQPRNGEPVYTGGNSPKLVVHVDNVSDTVTVGPQEANVQFGEDATVRVVAHEAKPGKCPGG